MTDFVISNDLIVFGMSTFAGGQTFDGQTIIDVDDTEALLVRKDGDGGDVFRVNTSADRIEVPTGALILSGVGPHALAGGGIGNVQLGISGEYTSTGGGQTPSSMAFDTVIVGNSSDSRLEAFAIFTEIQVVSSGVVDDVSTMVLSETFTSITGGGSVTNEQNLLIERIGLAGDSTYGIRILTNQAGGSTAAIIIEADPLSGDGLLDSEAILLRGQGFESATPHSIDWKFFVDVTANDGTGSIWTLQNQLDGAGFVTKFTIDDAGNLTIPGALAVSGAGPHAIGGTPSGIIGLIISETFTSDGAATLASGVFITQTLVGASGDTTSLTGVTFVSAITTQTATEDITNISQVEINEPFITNNLTGSITNAQSLLIVNAPTEGVANYALRVASGDVLFSDLQFSVGEGSIGDIFQVEFGGNFGSGGSSTFATNFRLSAGLVGAAGDTGSLTNVRFEGGVTTQTATESIGEITQLRVAAPTITDNLTGGGLITTAQALLIPNAPSAGVNNYALRVITGNVFFGGAQAIFGNGTAALPGIVFEADLDTGFYMNAGDDSLLVSVNANSIVRFDRASSLPRVNLSSDCQLTWLSGAAQGGGVQFVLGREAADANGAPVGDLFLSNTHLSIYQSRTSSTIYHRTSFRFSDETLSNVSGATVSTTSLIPNGALVLGVTTEVTVALGTGNGTTGYEVGDGSDSDRWGNITGTSTATFSDDADFSTSFLNARFTAGGDVTLTAVGGDFDGTGDILVVVHWLEVGARK